ncbi:hypothetical protein BV25DRAFT_1908395 [Artomyces pyxidatus]|uniref:Uncharacterized protein n=1 Tax=Artomyces pyxidatus TaxID=48021 RepID=A0ACB8SVX7_9AGAM|nr:hypothetical protein BV25DRAFT_1908395 [Artomyces pyxidatus]
MLHASTIFTHNPSSILTYLKHLPPELASHPLLFTLSSNTPQRSLSPLVSALTAVSTVDNVGCLSAAFPERQASSRQRIACSLAFFDKHTATLFRSTIRGRAETQVGRWHAMRKKEDARQLDSDHELEGEVKWEDVWSRSEREDELPPELRDLSKDNVQAVISLTDNASQGLTNALRAFPQATKLGLVASSTPFVTGRPCTLLRNADVYSSGAVGVAVTAGQRLSQRTAFPGLKPITPQMTVTLSEGNLVNELDGINPIRTLMTAIQNSGITGDAAKDDDFYLSVLQDGKPSQVYHILSGGPSRGTMALESDRAPVEGTRVQICHRSSHKPIYLPSSLSQPGHKTLAFMKSPADRFDHSVDWAEEHVEDDIRVLKDTFLGLSENGFILSRYQNGMAEPSWKCMVTAGLASLAWP